MIAFAKPPVPESCCTGAQCTLAMPAPCPCCCDDPNPADFTIEFSGLPEGMAVDPYEAERLKRELMARGLI